MARRRRKPGPLAGPARDESALVIRVANPAAITAAAAAFAAGEASPQPQLGRVREYVRRTGAVLTPLFKGGKRFTDTGAGIERARWELGVRPAAPDGTRLPSTFHLQMDSPADAAALLAELQGAGGQQAGGPGIAAHHPAIFHAPEPRPFKGLHKDHQWALEKCGFSQVWDALDTGDEPPPLAVIDDGAHTGHPDLEGCITRHEPPLEVPQSASVHASSVAGVLAAIRGNDDVNGMAGCCSAKVHLFNVFNGRFDYKAFHAALEEVLEGPLRVVNLSLTTRESDETVDELIGRCVAAEKVLVAAMGDFAREGSPPMFPAASPGVIAVGGTTRHDRRYAISSTGQHIWIAAPAKNVWTVFGPQGYEPLDGTSYATAMVSAGVWLALRQRPELTLAQVRGLLSRSVAPRPAVPHNTSFVDIGHGRLDMVRLKDALPTA